VNVIGHDHRSVQSELAAVFFHTTFKNNISGFWRKFPAVICGESDEDWPVILLDVGKTAAVIIFRQY
jgi:hypothetical protein